MAPINFSFTGTFDIITGLVLYLTVSPVPEVVAAIHAVFLVYKGAALFVPLPLGIPGFILGNVADWMSAAIIMIGTPPLLGGYKVWIAGFLFFKGLMGFLSMMNM